MFQFGHDDDPSGLLIVMGQLLSMSGTNDPRERLWTQVESAPGGTLTLDNSDGLLRFYDLAGNLTSTHQKEVVLPMNIYPTYITCERGPAAAAERIRTAKINGKRPAEILPHDFAMRVGEQPTLLTVTLHNCINQPIQGELEIAAPISLKFATSKQAVALAAGESKDLRFMTISAKPDDQNDYPCSFHFVSDAGIADYAEVMHAPKGTKIIDVNLDDWQDVPGVLVVAGSQKTEMTELLQRPWLGKGNFRPEGHFAVFKVAWDDNFLYFAARVNGLGAHADSPPMAGRDENAYFHTAKDDNISPYTEFLKQFPGRSFAEVPYVYAQNPEKPDRPDLPVIPFRRNRLQIAIDCVDDWHDLQPDTDRVPIGFHAVPDTDYEYAVYPCQGGTSELWRLLAPGVPRRHDFPRTVQGPRTTGPVPGARHVVKREGNTYITYIYEAAIPRDELADLKLVPGTTFGLMLRAGNKDGPDVDLGSDKALTKINGLTLHPYWSRSNSCGLRWTLVE